MRLRKCPNHGFEEIAQLSILINGLRFDMKMLLDIAVGGTMMVADVEQERELLMLWPQLIIKLSMTKKVIKREDYWS